MTYTLHALWSECHHRHVQISEVSLSLKEVLRVHVETAHSIIVWLGDGKHYKIILQCAVGILLFLLAGEKVFATQVGK